VPNALRDKKVVVVGRGSGIARAVTLLVKSEGAHVVVAGRDPAKLAGAYGERSGNCVTISWPVTQSELASLASVAEPTAQKALRQLRKDGVISTGYRSLTIEDFSALNRIAGE